MALRHYQELVVWQKAMDLAAMVTEVTRRSRATRSLG
jgi:hypothetical protein